MSFRYLRDPLFLTCFSVYWLNKCLCYFDVSPVVARAHLNDLICIPFWIPMVLWAQRQLGLRDNDDPPHADEVVIPLLIIAFVFEVVLPSSQTWSGLAVPDPVDVVCYATGAFVSVSYWTWFYRKEEVATITANDG